MTQTDYVKEKLAMLKLLMTGLTGALVTLAVYNLQSSGFNQIIVLAAMIILFVLLYYSCKEYKKLLTELKDLP